MTIFPHSGNASHIDVPAGTRLVLRAKTDKRLRTPDGVRLKTPADGVTLTQPGDETFQVACDNVTTPLDLTLEFTDTDGVIGQRQVIVRPLDDLPPDVDVQVEVVRRTSQGYLVTPLARSSEESVAPTCIIGMVSAPGNTFC